MEREMEEGVKRETKGDRKERQQGREGESTVEEREEERTGREGRGGKDGDAIDAADAAYQRALSEAQRVFEEGQEKRVSERAELDRTYEAAGTAREQAATDYVMAVARCDGADR